MRKQRNQQINNNILEFIKDFIATKKYSPTVREINEHFNWSSSSSAYFHLMQLAIDGKIDWDKNKTRTIRVIDNE